MDEKSLSQLGAKLLDIIRRGKFASKGQRAPVNLVKLRDNLLKDQNLVETEKNFLLEEIKKELHIGDPRVATKIYGPKETVAKEDLQAIYDLLSEKYDFKNSIVKEGVKIGGDMIAGRMFVDVYFSFKNEEKWHATFARSQNSVAEEQFYKVAIYNSGRNDPSLEEDLFSLKEKTQAIALFEHYLERLI